MALFKAVLGLVFAIVLTVQVIVPQFKNANTTGWTSAETAIFGLGSLGVIGGLAYAAYNTFGVE